jgi:hypothetical protein
MNRRSLPDDCVLARTPEGTRRMRDRSAGLPARLRSVLFLVDGSQSLSRILGRAGQLGPLLEDQLAELIDMGLVHGVGDAVPVAAPAKAPRLAAAPAAAGKSVPIVDAKVRLLESFERAAGGPMKQAGSSLVEARTWRDLAGRARDLSFALRQAGSEAAATRFWSEAKQILVSCREREADGVRP